MRYKPHTSKVKIKQNNPSLFRKALSVLNPVNADFLGHQFGFNFKNESNTFQTLPGGVLSIIVTSITFFIAMTSILNFRDRTSPVVSVSTQYQFDPPDFDLYEQNLIPPIALSNGLGIIPPELVPSFATIKLVVHFMKPDEATGIPVYKHEVSIDYVPCSTVKDRTLMDAIEEANPDSFGLINKWGVCPDTNKLTSLLKATGRFEKPPFRMILIQILPCSLPDRSLCRSVDELKGLSMTHVTVKKAFDAANYEKPIKYLPEFDAVIAVDRRSTKFTQFNLR